MFQISEPYSILTYTTVCLPLFSCIYAFEHNFHFLAIILLCQVFAGIDYVKYNQYIFGGYDNYNKFCKFVSIYLYALSFYSKYRQTYQYMVYNVLGLYLLCKYCNMHRYAMVAYIYSWTHYLSNICLLLMISGLPKIIIEYYFVDENGALVKLPHPNFIR